MPNTLQTIHFVVRGLVRSQMRFYMVYAFASVIVSPCHHSTVPPQVVDGGTASNMEGSCKYTE